MDDFIQKLKETYLPYKNLEGDALNEVIFATKPGSGACGKGLLRMRSFFFSHSFFFKYLNWRRNVVRYCGSFFFVLDDSDSFDVGVLPRTHTIYLPRTFQISFPSD